MTERLGHVPEENLERYRGLKKIAEQFGTLGAVVSGKGQYDDANTCWALEAKYQRLANELRVKIPDGSGEQ